MRISDCSSDVCSSDLRAQFGRGAQRIRNPLCGALVVGRERHAHMTIIEDRVVLTVGLLDLVEALRDQERLDAVAGHEGERGFEEIERSEERRVGKECVRTCRSRWSPYH